VCSSERSKTLLSCQRWRISCSISGRSMAAGTLGKCGLSLAGPVGGPSGPVLCAISPPPADRRAAWSLAGRCFAGGTGFAGGGSRGTTLLGRVTRGPLRWWQRPVLLGTREPPGQEAGERFFRRLRGDLVRWAAPGL